MKKYFSPFVSTLLLLIIGLTTLSGFKQLIYADAEEGIELDEKWGPEEKDDYAGDNFGCSGSDDDAEVEKKTPFTASHRRLTSIFYWPVGFSTGASGSDYHYLAVSSSFLQVQRERQCTPRQPLFILYCTYTSSLPILV